MNPADLLIYAAPITFAALGETIGQKSGVINVGLEGTMLLAAFGAFAGCTASGDPVVGLALAGLIGATAAAFQALFTLKLAVDQVVVGSAMNLLAVGVSGTLFRKMVGQSGELFSLPTLPRWWGIDLGTLFLAAGLALTYYTLSRTRWGLAVRAAGEYPDALEAGGFNALTMRWHASLVNGLLVGLGGGLLTVSVAGSFAENFTNGRGFVALAMVTFGRWQPIWVVASCGLVGFADMLQFKFQALQIHAPPQVWHSLPYLMALAVLVVAGKGRGAPEALGRPYSRKK